MEVRSKICIAVVGSVAITIASAWTEPKSPETLPCEMSWTVDCNLMSRSSFERLCANSPTPFEGNPGRPKIKLFIIPWAISVRISPGSVRNTPRRNGLSISWKSVGKFFAAPPNVSLGSPAPLRKFSRDNFSFIEPTAMVLVRCFKPNNFSSSPWKIRKSVGNWVNEISLSPPSLLISE